MIGLWKVQKSDEEGSRFVFFSLKNGNGDEE